MASNEDDLAELIIACKQGRLYDVERWIASGHPLQLDPGVEVRIRRKPTAMSLSISSGALDLTRLLLCNGYRQELESSPPLDAALERRRWDLLELLLDWGAEWQPATSIADYEYALREIAELARSRGAEVWFLTAPQAFHDAEGIARYEALPPGSIARRLLEFNAVATFACMGEIHESYVRATREVAKELDAPLVDMAALYARSNNEALFSMEDGLHPGPHGHQLEARALYRRLMESNVLNRQ